MVPLLAYVGLLPGCFEKQCGPNQKRADGYCECVEGTKLNDELDCVKTEARKPVDASDASTDGMAPMAGGCDMTTGLGCTCAGDEDCAGFEASYCVIPDPADETMTRVCLLQGCDKPGKECPDVMQCCDFPFAPEKTICLPKVVDNMDYKCPF